MRMSVLHQYLVKLFRSDCPLACCTCCITHTLSASLSFWSLLATHQQSAVPKPAHCGFATSQSSLVLLGARISKDLANRTFRHSPRSLRSWYVLIKHCRSFHQVVIQDDTSYFRARRLRQFKTSSSGRSKKAAEDVLRTLKQKPGPEGLGQDHQEHKVIKCSQVISSYIINFMNNLIVSIWVLFFGGGVTRKHCHCTLPMGNVQTGKDRGWLCQAWPLLLKLMYKILARPFEIANTWLTDCRILHKMSQDPTMSMCRFHSSSLIFPVSFIDFCRLPVYRVDGQLSNGWSRDTCSCEFISKVFGCPTWHLAHLGLSNGQKGDLSGWRPAEWPQKYSESGAKMPLNPSNGVLLNTLWDNTFWRLARNYWRHHKTNGSNHVCPQGQRGFNRESLWNHHDNNKNSASSSSSSSLQCFEEPTKCSLCFAMSGDVVLTVVLWLSMKPTLRVELNVSPRNQPLNLAGNPACLDLAHVEATRISYVHPDLWIWPKAKAAKTKKASSHWNGTHAYKCSIVISE